MAEKQFTPPHAKLGKYEHIVGAQKYPEIRQRGFYSDVVLEPDVQAMGDVMDGPERDPNHMWDLRTADHTPMVHTFQSPENLMEQITEQTDHGPTTKLTELSDFPLKAYEPKVQLPFYTPPGQRPRRVEVERRKRAYQQMDIEQILLERYRISTDQLVPKQTDEGNRLGDWRSYLNLEVFDNTDYDCRLPEEWLAMGMEDGVRKPVPGRALLPSRDDQHDLDIRDPAITWRWQMVGVLDYDPDSQLWLVMKVNKKGRLVDSDGNPVVNGGYLGNGQFLDLSSMYWVPRIQLYFLAEDPTIFAMRVAEAFADRQRAEAHLRYHLYLDCMPSDGLGEADKNSFNRMIEWAKGTPSLSKAKKLDDKVQSLDKEVNFDFSRSMNKIIFNGTIAHHEDQYSYVTVPQSPDAPVPDRGCVNVPDYNFDEAYSAFAFHSLLTRPESITAIGWVRSECNEVAAKSLFQVPLAKHMRLEEFEQTQQQATQHVALYLRDTFKENLRRHIRTSLRDSGKGWFDLNTDKFYVYQGSKLKKFMEMVKFSMQDSLRYLVQDSLTNFTQMIVDACQACLNLPANYTWPHDLLVSSLPPKRNPLFLVDLVLDMEGSHYSTNLNQFEATLIALFDKAIASTQTVPQLEKFILENLKDLQNETLLLESVWPNEPEVERLRVTIREAIGKSLVPLKTYARLYDRFLALNNLEITHYIAEYEAKSPTAIQMKEEVEKHLAEKEVMERIIPSSIIIGPFFVATETVRQNLSKKCKAMANAVLELLAKKLRKQADDACEEFKSISRRLFETPNTIEDLSETREWMKGIPDKLDEHQENIDLAMADYDLIEEFYYNLSQEDFNARYTAMSWPNKIVKQMEQVEKTMEEAEERFRKLQVGDTSTFNDRLDSLTMSVASLSTYTDISKAHEVANEVRRIAKQLKDAGQDAQKFNNRERLFGMPVTDYSKLAKLNKDFEPYRAMWISVSEWIRMRESVMSDPLHTIDAENVSNQVNEAGRIMHKSVRIFQEFPGVQEVAAKIKSEVEDFKPYIPLIQGLRNPGMRSRHWEQLSAELKMTLVAKKELTFARCLEMRLQDHIEVIAKVAEVAGKEYSIELALRKMQSDWESVSFEVMAYKDTGTYIVKIGEEVNQQLDDHIVMTQQISFSQFKKPFENEINKWESKLRTSQDVLEEWVNCQRQWLYLEPIFSSDDINRQLPLEGKRYSTMERMWRKIMKNAKENPKVIEICPDNRLLDNLKECNKLLDQVQKGLSEYLETKRKAFPRFYFLSDDELLEILSQTKDPTAVQPHLRKCFENIAKLRFEEDLEITAMFSGEGEMVEFTDTTYPTGNVEDWMLEIENIMKESMRKIIEKSLIDYKKSARTDWVLKWPGQIVIAGCQTYWTSEVTEALERNDLKGLYPFLLEQLDGLRGLVRGDISRIGRMTLSALIVIEVHARDVVNNMLEEQVSNANDFEWISQLRYYWVEEEQDSGKTVGHMKLRAVNAQFQYGYEYLGNSSRLVITPLTDRCYLTLTGALHLKFGGAPAGPAGTGKTETTKDLAKAMAIQCVVFNCSDQLDFMAMGKFFKGLASSGAWACFDEFNRIDIEVLSVVAQQIAEIQTAQKQRVDRFDFEGVDLPLKASCAVFITMNPGYAGRTELPDNLKALFRPVAMMVPDYALIAEISLFSFGFGEAKFLAKKIVTTFKLSSEQLSSQDHYDFGMRAVKSVISAAGNLKRQNPDMNEELICLRAIRDVNVPKFLMDDLKLFSGIVSDLFPNIKEEPIDYGNLMTAIKEACRKLMLKDVDGFTHKCIQLFETTVVRHGLMLVGPTGSGKTKCYEVLKEAMSSLKGEPSPAGETFETVHTSVLNPKSITMGQLYGEFDLMTHEWTDGILSTLIRVGAASTDPDKRWYLFDGPVDAVWIENMNTVLDDNKKLCLSSGEIIKLTENMTMMFEVQDLAVASPATVSRCGMVYLEPSILGLAPFVECWIRGLPEEIYAHKAKLEHLFSTYMEDAIDFVRKGLKEIVSTTNGQLTFSLLKMMDTFFKPFVKSEELELGTRRKKKEEEKTLPQEVLDKIGEVLEPWFFFSLVWSVGATCDNDSRKKFDRFLRGRMSHDDGVTHKFPEEGLVYDYFFNDGNFLSPKKDDEEEEEAGAEQKKAKDVMRWENWMESLSEFVIPSDAKFSEIIVPTIDNVRSSRLIEMLLVNRKRVLCVGPTGTGKTLSITDKLNRNMPQEFMIESIVFSAKTSSNQTQDLIDGKLDKRRKGVFGPPLGKQMIFFIDDLNMPALEVYGAQPPIELIRQWADFSGWYDRKAIGEFRRLIDVNFICAMGPPGGGRNPVTARLQRHFNFLAFTEMEDDSMTKIFGTILSFWTGQRSGNLSRFTSQMVKTCIAVYSEIQRVLLPTPAKSHYTFNLRDLSKVFQGILMVDANNVSNLDDLLRLWYHESCRVFQDRLVNDDDRNWFRELLKQKMHEDFDRTYEEVVTREPVLYGDFLSGVENKQYVEFTNPDEMVKRVEEHLEDYNQINTAQMQLVLFMDAIRHVCRIARIIRQPLGNALLLGMGGSGRQSLTRLAAHMAEFDCFQIELSKNYGVTEWRDDLKKVMMKAGLENQPVVFLFSDTQIKSESFLEDLNNVLNAGDVPNIYAADEMDAIFNAMKPLVQDAGLAATKTNFMAAYTRRVRSNLHTVITMSPIGEVFRARLRQFPALVTCCTIDWFSAWPAEALESVALRFLNDIQELEVTEATINCLVTMCQAIHSSVTDNTERFKAELSRYNYVTPTSYLELLGIFSKLYGMKKSEIQTARNRTKNGLDKLLETEQIVSKLQEDLEVLKPQLEESVKEMAVMTAKIQEDQVTANEVKSVVAKEEAAATVKAKQCKAIKDDAQRDLDEALPALDAALNSLKNLNRNDIVEVRAMMRPPAGVTMVVEAVCIMMQVKPNKVAGEKLGTKVDSYWEPGKVLLADPGKFLDSLFTYDKDNIPEAVISKIQPYIDSENFQPAAIAKVSKACTSICQWARAMHKYHFVAMSVAPKRAALAEAEQELNETMRTLEDSRARLKEAEDRIATLQASYDEKIRSKRKLEEEQATCEGRLYRADKLIGGLGNEKDRWKETVTRLDFALNNIVGNVLLSAAYIAYLGPFTSDYRNRMCNEWVEDLQKFTVPFTRQPAPNLTDTLGDPVRVRSWQIYGLPKDNYSTENAVIVQYSRRWPLFIDPQGQANKWVRNLEKDQGVDVIKLSDKDFLRSLENAVRFGKPCLLENVGEELDPALEPILLKQTFKQQGSTVIKLGDAVIPYHEDFKFYITTKLSNPHYTPEVSTKVTVINFTLSPSGLEDQLLAIVVAEERPDLEDAKNQLIVSNAKMKAELKEIEDEILRRLSESKGSPVDDEDLIKTLDASTAKSAEINAKVIVSEQTERDIDETRSKYVPVAVRTQILFFCVADLAKIDPMYQYSLEWFINIFLNGITNAERADNIEKRIVNINEFFTYSLYTNVCRSLFEKHKLLFSFLLASRILQNDGKINMLEWRFLLAGGTHRAKELDNPAPDWISDRSWNEVLTLGALDTFKALPDEFAHHLAEYKAIFDSIDPEREALPGHWDTDLDAFQKLLIVRCLRPDKVTNAMQDFVANFLGQRFIEPQTANLSLVFKDSSATTPLIFVLSQGTDPASDLKKFADEMRFSKKLDSVSLGQGQGPVAESKMRSAMERGKWVFFQNCHLAPSFMPMLERLVEQIDPDKVHRDFRLWLTSMPSPKFPVYILQNGSKMTVEPPRGIKANLLKSYLGVNDDLLNSVGEKHSERNYQFKSLLLSLSLFHGVLLERRKYGALGFNIPYEFTDGDLKICQDQLQMFLNEYAEIPYKVLKYTAGHINYGGRVTDDWDRRCVMNILGEFYHEQVLDGDFRYSESGTYRQINPESDHAAYLSYVKSLPINDTPEIFGLHDNANITFAQNETFAILGGLLQLQPKTSSGGGKTREEVTETVARDILAKVPNPIPTEPVLKKYPVMYEQSMNTVLVQEVIRFNNLLKVIKQSLNDLLKAIKGLVVMSQSLEDMANSLFDNLVPALWSRKAYPSLKPLASWVEDLVERVDFIKSWIEHGMPAVYWISGFFFPQAFLTGTLQNYARKMVISIDTISFEFDVLKEAYQDIREGPKDGCYIRGLFLEGARWDHQRHVLSESKPKELYTDMPAVWLIPKANRKGPSHTVYDCPVYKTLTRAGTLSTTGHSTNFVFALEIPSDKEQKHWIKRGVALFCALNY